MTRRRSQSSSCRRGEQDERRDLLRVFEKYHVGQMERRDFLRACSIAGVSLAASGLLQGCERVKRWIAPPSLQEEIKKTIGPNSAIDPSTEQHRFLTEMKKRFRGVTLDVVCEDTPPAAATVALMKEEFAPLTGIEVRWERRPLDQVLARIVSETALQTGAIDILYIDEGWLARFADDLVEHSELLMKSDLAYPEYDFPDILPELVKHIGTHKGKLVGIPYDIPVHIMIYRKDIFDKLRLPVPTTMASYMETVRAIQQELGPRIYGTTGMWKAGHYSLYIEMAICLWAHGGSIYGSDGRSKLNDDRAKDAMRYMLELGKWMPPAVTTWDWNGAVSSFARGDVGVALMSGEYFSGFDDPASSKIVGLAEPAPCPEEVALRSPADCGFEETPGISRQGGSCLAISRYSKNQDAAWILLQWATSSDITTRASLLGGGSSPIRASNYADPRTRARARVMAGTTRQFPAALDAIRHRMGTDPHLPEFDELVDVLAAELGKLTTGQQDLRTTTSTMARSADAIARG